MTRALAVLGAVLVMSLTACGGPKVDQATHDKYVQVEAQRLCDIQRQTYPTEQELNDAFTKAMDDSGISPADQKILREQREDDVKLRQEIDSKYKSICV